ncbi:Transcriptional repressor EZH1 [Pseudoloma neurophilia]|uniref:Transcriptional repressor EZH1 n=1 Tax=Pseudoloma neurophilia TaxID=146866 RepID=A0A0R0LVU5_9MICR|nr:Transcriptional repressor EZH1 [Pseudoloma neurophilia]
MTEFLKKIEQKYNNEVKRILKLNKQFVKEEKPPTEEYNPKEFFQAVIPKITRQPFFRYFTETNINVEGTDDTVLRFVPFIESNQEYTSITNFEDTLLLEEPLTREQAIKEKFLRDEAFKRFDERHMYKIRNRMCKDPDFLNRSTMIEDEYSGTLRDLKLLSTKIDMPVSKILEVWIQDFDTRPQQLYRANDNLNHFFCSVCLLFDCSFHESKQVKVPKVETFSTIPCSNDCYMIASDNESINLENFSDPKVIKIYTKIVRDFSPSPCELKKMLNFFIKLENGTIFTCRDAKYIISTQPIEKVPYKKHPFTFAPSTFKKTSHPEIQQPCMHPGSCYKNKNCKCFTRRIFCEPTCHCEKCDLVFGGCSCKNIKKTEKTPENEKNKKSTGSGKKRGSKFLKNSKKKKENGSADESFSSGCPCALNLRECTPLCECRAIQKINPEDFEENEHPNQNELTNKLRYMRVPCKNQAMAHLKEKETYAAASNIDGYGLFATYPIKKSEFVISYAGELITNDETERRGFFYEKRKLSYLFDLSILEKNQHCIIDATKIGNKARFINHSRTPNLCAKTIQVDGNFRIGFYAIKDIAQDEELFFDYAYKEDQKKKYEIKD